MLNVYYFFSIVQQPYLPTELDLAGTRLQFVVQLGEFTNNIDLAGASDAHTTKRRELKHKELTKSQLAGEQMLRRFHLLLLPFSVILCCSMVL